MVLATGAAELPRIGSTDDLHSIPGPYLLRSDWTAGWKRALLSLVPGPVRACPGTGNAARISGKNWMEEATDGLTQLDHNAPQSRCYDNLTAVALQDLPQLSRDQMGWLWEALVRTAVPKSLSLPLMLRFVAFELQARDQGGLPDRFVATIAGCVSDAGRSKALPTKLRPGGRLLREWNGTTHVVDIVEGGFVWRGATYASLSAIAGEITGAHWSGPRFFGLTGPARPGHATNTKAPAPAASARAGRGVR